MSCSSASVRTKWFVSNLIFCSALVLFLQLPVLASQSLTLTWDASVGSAVAGYRIHYGTASHDYSAVVTVANTNVATIDNLPDGTTCYFAASAVDATGNESALSNETSITTAAAVIALTTPAVTPPAPIMLAAPSLAGGQFNFAVSGVPGQSCVVQASTNLRDWVSIQTNTLPFVFVDVNAASYHQRFYRTLNL